MNSLLLKEKSSNFFSRTSIFFIVLSFYAYLLFEAKMGLQNSRFYLFVLGYLGFSVSLFFCFKIVMNKKIFLYFLSSIGFYFLSALFWDVKIDLNVYLSAITAIVIIHQLEFFYKIMKIVLSIALLFSLFEFVNKEYIFVVMRETIFGFRPLDEKFFGGHDGIFRAKAFFEGPLALSQFAIGLAFLYRNEWKILVLIFFIALFANGRLGIIISGFMILLYFIKKYNIVSLLLRPKYMFYAGVIFVVVICGLFYFLDETSLERLKNVFNTDNKGNNSRIEYWINGWETWLDYSWDHKLFGNNGFFQKKYGNNAENGWVTLLVNNGLLGFCYYFIPVLALLIHFFRLVRIEFIYILLLVFCMFVQTFHLGASANLIYWLIIYSFFKQNAYVKA